MRPKQLDDLLDDLTVACAGAATVEIARHFSAARLKEALDSAREVRLRVQALEARLAQALRSREKS